MKLRLTSRAVYLVDMTIYCLFWLLLCSMHCCKSVRAPKLPKMAKYGFKNYITMWISSLWISYHMPPPVLSFRRRNHEQPIPVPKHVCLTQRYRADGLPTQSTQVFPLWNLGIDLYFCLFSVDPCTARIWSGVEAYKPPCRSKRLHIFRRAKWAMGKYGSHERESASRWFNH